MPSYCVDWSFEFSSVVFRNTLFTGFSQLRTFSDRVCGCKYDHITALPRELHWRPLEHEQWILNYATPTYNHHLFQTCKPVRSLRSSTMNLLVTPRSRLKFYRTIMLRLVALNFRVILQTLTV